MHESRKPPARHPDQLARSGQSVLVTLGLSIMLGACGPAPAPVDGGSDAGIDAAISPTDGGIDAAIWEDAMTDAGPTPSRTCVRPDASDPARSEARRVGTGWYARP